MGDPECKLDVFEGDVPTENVFGGHGGMGVNRMDLEEALDDGLSIVPSTGQYSLATISTKMPSTSLDNGTEHEQRQTDDSADDSHRLPIPNTNTSSNGNLSPSTLSTGYRPRGHSNKRVNYRTSGTSSTVTVDDEKETKVHSHGHRHRQGQGQPVQHIPKHAYNVMYRDRDREKWGSLLSDRASLKLKNRREKERMRDRKERERRKVNHNGNPFISQEELERDYVVEVEVELEEKTDSFEADDEDGYGYGVEVTYSDHRQQQRNLHRTA